MAERPGRLEGKVAIVTGAGSRGPGVGNGKATAVLFAREGASVLLVDAQIERADETLAMIEAEGGVASTFQADVTNEDDCKAMVEAAVERHGRLDVLDNNVGIGLGPPVTEIDMDEWDKVQNTNVRSMVLTSRHAIPRMIQTGGGSIINISSGAGIAAIGAAAYTTSKAAVIGLTIAMAGDHGRQGIRINCVAPGLVFTPMVADMMDADLRQHRRNSTMLGTEGTAWDVGNAALFLASEDARWITGQVLSVDAGMSVTSRHAYQEW
ncbi:MAG TPA: SDR family NAD(P)-dependent oxidoreductase [Dehalococcoidia bacterium]|jgi:NAD(P)-dependent dehydrogenase (short-subunit alcohol dehydrogenase family)|nr:SDR family NAD(P)-dependent oxidoreductase [Dehalococcoidia bacterium]MDP6274270.1 SDR family NAD(P)-dependent oxidoreductase [Dehalococcoidia bacterium]MDP7161204.1 SDR family NAD(P)-dependent oxidoreductase [Dehalococcoidia bacterium]MDP7213562.1 SDR family NAD(P)-dependent oxidoreductase [Dehalococcoidia bacterium]MDP7515196.1 SDR family NAD(P)-dependent oxidoreductase [Dehalococcoidia bacterium]|tara:strand:+ start:560 stop:1357 length:798 start_codon:yes stop_codon:yes gene_type:complete